MVFLPKDWHTFEDARKFVHSLNFKNRDEWVVYAKTKKPEYIPYNPNRTYKDEWVSWGDWLGTYAVSTHCHKKMPFKEARKFVRSLGLRNRKEWREYCTSGKKPRDIPSNAWTSYKKDWISLSDWLGGTNKSPQYKYRLFADARAFVHTLGIKSCAEWREYCMSEKKPIDIPFEASRTYDDDWISWGDWLGNDNVYRQRQVQSQKMESLGHKYRYTDNEELFRYTLAGIIDMLKCGGVSRKTIIRLSVGVKPPNINISNRRDSVNQFIDMVAKIASELPELLDDNLERIVKNEIYRIEGY